MYTFNVRKRIFFILSLFINIISIHVQAQAISPSNNASQTNNIITSTPDAQLTPSKEQIIENIKQNITSLKSYTATPQDIQNNQQQIQTAVNSLDSNFQKVFSNLSSATHSTENNSSVLMPRERKSKSYRNNLTNLPIAQPNAT